MRVSRFGCTAVVAAAFGIILQAPPARAAFSKQELKCSSTLAKGYAKLQASILKAKTACHANDILGEVDSPDGCATLPQKDADKIVKAKESFVKKVGKKCASVCAISTDKVCVSDLTCPPRHQALPANNSIAERCLGKGGAAPFSLANLDWPGPYCDAILGHPMTDVSDLGNCVLGLLDTTSAPLEKAVFADLDEGDSLTEANVKCASGISKALSTAVSKAYVATAACRDGRRSAGITAWACSKNDVKAIDTIDKAIGKLSIAIDKSCVDADIVALTGLCADGGVTPTDRTQAKACLSDLVRELATEERGSNNHKYAVLSMLNATHPNSATAYCGDGIVTTWREEHTGVGEECDGAADTACGAGSCLPPGDLFECTCDTTPRERFIVDGSAGHSDSDAGWKGTSHDATHNDGYGYVTDLSNCTCDSFSQATCTTPSGDDICDVHANMAPRCSDDLHGTETCDERGNGNGIPQNSDCFRCDDNSINAGTYCGAASVSGDGDETACQSRCFDDLTGLAIVPDQPCQNQAACGAGKTCKGRCDNSLTCNTMTEGSPLPQISAATAVCITLEYRTDITGTKNIVTGETALHYATRSNIQLGEAFTIPCPLCGGVCVGGSNNNKTCFGRCDASDTACLVDSDCTGMGDTACLETDDECIGGTCTLDLRCSSGEDRGRLCRPDAATALGVVSRDCRPAEVEFVSGAGVMQNFGTVTSEVVEFPPGMTCTDPAWHNFECPCPADSVSPPIVSSTRTRPNGCAATCDGGVNEGKGCGTGGGSTGVYSVCVLGSDAGFVCDDDSDCEGGSCTSVIKECTAGTPSLIGTSCTTDIQCGGGGVCSESCPGARCVPLCYPEGACTVGTGGTRTGDPCATLRDCRQCTSGHPLMIDKACGRNSDCDHLNQFGGGVCEIAPGVTCDVTDPEDGLCAAGPDKLRCTGVGFTSAPCLIKNGNCAAGLCTETNIPPPPSPAPGVPCAVNSDCLADGVPFASGCENGTDGVPGNSDDNPGAGDCELRPEDCYVNNGLAEGGDTLNGQGTPSEPKLVAAFCTPPNGNNLIDDVSGFGGPSRIRRSGSAFVNVPSIP